jgi:hypothetical protein
MPSVARGPSRPPAAGTPVAPPVVALPAAGGAAAAADDTGPLPAGLEPPRRRALAALWGVVRLSLTALVGGVAHRLCRRPAAVTLASLEVELRDALLTLGATLLGELVRLRGPGHRGPSYVCPCGVRLVLKEIAPLRQRTWFGTITLERAVYAGAGCTVRAHRVPLDADWGLLGAGAAPAPTPVALPDPDGGALAAVAPGPGPARLAPAFAAVVVEFGARLPYVEAARLLALALGPVARLAPNTIKAYTQAAGRARAEQEDALVTRRRRLTRGNLRERATHATPPRPAAAPDTLAIHMDGALERTTEGWKEVKLGALCAAHPAPAPAPGAAPAAGAAGPTTYTATLAPAAAFGRQLQAAAERRGLRWARRVVVLGDGAKWIWKLASQRFPRATQVVDWYHAHEHLWQLAQLLYGEGTVAAWTWLETLAGVLWTAQTAADVALLAHAADEAWATPRKDLPDGTPRRTATRHRAVATAVAYFATNAARLRYGAFRTQGLPVGSGVVEGGCRSVLHVRLKRPGARWSPAAAEAMARARAVLCSDPTPDCSHPDDLLAA